MRDWQELSVGVIHENVRAIHESPLNMIDKTPFLRYNNNVS